MANVKDYELPEVNNAMLCSCLCVCDICMCVREKVIKRWLKKRTLRVFIPSDSFLGVPDYVDT